MLALALAALVAASSPGDPAQWNRNASRAEAAGAYAEAASWYSRIVSGAASSYFARKARSRRDELAAHADFGYEPYRRFEALRKEYRALGSDGAVAEAREILAEFPTAQAAPELRYWLGNEFREARGDLAAAAEEYRRLADDFPAHPLAPIALDRIGRMLEQRGRFDEARGVYAELERRYPDSGSRADFEKRRELAARGKWRKRAALASRWVLAFAAVLFVAAGGWRFEPRRLWPAVRGKIAFALLLGLAPATFLHFYDGIFSPSLSTLSAAFAGYALVLGALAARRAAPPGRMWRAAERVVFGILAPLAILALILHHYRLWEAFML